MAPKSPGLLIIPVCVSDFQNQEPSWPSLDHMPPTDDQGGRIRVSSLLVERPLFIHKGRGWGMAVNNEVVFVIKVSF